MFDGSVTDVHFHALGSRDFLYQGTLKLHLMQFVLFSSFLACTLDKCLYMAMMLDSNKHSVLYMHNHFGYPPQKTVKNKSKTV